MDVQSAAKILIAIGAAIIVIGVLLLAAGRFFGFGNLPGDIRIDGPGFSCFVPIVSMLLLSVILTIVLNILIRIINRP
ncbi:MAG: hypothetical protein CL610_09435 [Anaerolineaceae bacterium]|nr:hypothetical protein [Anaerolineaceae bacterium]